MPLSGPDARIAHVTTWKPTFAPSRPITLRIGRSLSTTRDYRSTDYGFVHMCLDT
jgi:hypothetical protein